MSVRRPAALAAAALLAASGSLVACSSDGDSTASEAVAVTASDDACVVASTELPVGSTTLEVKNEGSKVTEVYVYGADGDDFTKVIGEVENIGPGITRDFTVELEAGRYEVACKPGQTGEGIRTPITVGGGTATASSTAEAAYDRELELSTDGTSISGVPTTPAAAGERIEFKLENETDATRVLELKRPNGSVAGEVEVPAGTTGEVIVTLEPAGAWTVVVEGEGVEDLTAELEVA